MPETGTIADVNVDVNITHTWVGDLRIKLHHNGTDVVLWGVRTCQANDGLIATFDDAGSPVACAMPTTGSITPITTGGGNLSAFNGMDPAGIWTLTILDTFASLENGTFNNWSLTVETVTVLPFSEDTNANSIPDDCECNTQRGDMNGDGIVNALDIQAFLDAYLVRYSACADMYGNGPPLIAADVRAFVTVLLGRRLLLAVPLTEGLQDEPTASP